MVHDIYNAAHDKNGMKIYNAVVNNETFDE